MKTYLMYPDRDFNLDDTVSGQSHALIKDLGLDFLIKAMSSGEKLIDNASRSALLNSLTELETILYRQDILRDCIDHPDDVRKINGLIVALREKKKTRWRIYSDYPQAVLSRSIEWMPSLIDALKELRSISFQLQSKFRSDGFKRFFVMLTSELSDAYFAEIHNHLRMLKFKQGVMVSAKLGEALKGTDYILRKARGRKICWLRHLFSQKSRAYVFHIDSRDENGFKALSDLVDKGISIAANTIAQSVDHINSFLDMIQVELAFYLGCLNLHEKLVQKGEPIVFPVPDASDKRVLSFEGLYDVSLTLNMKNRVVGNDLDAADKNLFVITGANQGGKTTFLRSVGLAQLMMQCGLFVPARSFRANICDGIFTHFKREEDTTMKSGKLDEEFSRMSEIVDHLKVNSMVLLNESFAATNDREGSEIAKQIVDALKEKHIKVLYVTHLYVFAHEQYESRSETTMSLLAQRQPDGSRTFKLFEGEPLETSYGEDLFKQIFGLANGS